MSQHYLKLFDGQEEERPLSDILLELSRIPTQDIVVLLGKEPCLHSGFSEIISALMASNERHIILCTTGVQLALHPSLTLLHHLPNLNIFITPFPAEEFQCNNPTTFNRIYSQRLASISSFLNQQFHVAAVIPILPENATYLRDMVLGLNALGLTNIIFQYPTSNPPVPYHGKDKALTLKVGTDIFTGTSIDQSPSTAKFQSVRYSNIHHHVKAALDSVNFIVHVENIPPCMLGLDHHHASRFLTIDDANKAHAEPCTTCAKRDWCPGMYQSYLDHFGSTELGPLDEHGQPLLFLEKSTQPIMENINHIHEQLSQTFTSIDITPSPDEILRFLYLFHNYTTFWELVEESGYPLPVVQSLLHELEKANCIRIESDNQLRLAIELPISQPPHDFSTARLSSDSNLCQLSVRQKDLEKRVAYIINQCPSGGVLAVLGDDDFMSLTLASTGHFQHVVVFELDQRIVSTIQSITKRENLPVTVIQHDLRHEIPIRFHQQFDTFYTDCPYTPQGFELFTSRGITLLKKQPKHHGFVSFSPEIPIIEEVELPVQDIITQMGLYLQQKHYGASNLIPEEIQQRYPTASAVKEALLHPDRLSPSDQWYLSTLGRKEYLFHFLTTPKTKPTIQGQFLGEIYYEQHPLTWYLNHIQMKTHDPSPSSTTIDIPNKGNITPESTNLN